MLLITGGLYQGQLEYALKITGLTKEDLVDCESAKPEELFSAKLILDYHKLIKRMLSEEKDVAAFTSELIQRNPDAVVLVDEVGCGVVPIQAFDRLYRETTGRMSCELAKASKEVHRVFCGVGTVIKSDGV